MEQKDITAPDAPAVEIQQAGRIGRITLNRPKALNALNRPMVRAIAAALDAWRDDINVHAVVLEGSGRAFCAGADVRRLREAVLAGDMPFVEAFFTDEYALDHALATYPKPVVALIDGLCVGGGLGLAMHARFAVASPGASFAMPETAIGLFPDVGASFVLPKLRGQTGLYMALTGLAIPAAMARAAGLITHLWTGSLASLSTELEKHGLAALAEEETPPPVSEYDDIFAAIDACFSAPALPEILHRLAQTPGAWAQETLAAIREKSPHAVCWTFALMRSGYDLTLRQSLDRDLGMVMAVTPLPDFAEGIRALLVDKDRTPHWQAARIEDVDTAYISALLNAAAAYSAKAPSLPKAR